MRNLNMKRYSVNERGSTIIVVLAVLILMLSMGMAFLTMMRRDAEGSIQVKEAAVQAAPEQDAIDFVGGLIGQDVINMNHPKQQSVPGSDDLLTRHMLSGKPDAAKGLFQLSDQTIESFDYPGYFDTWLANNEPEIGTYVIGSTNIRLYSEWKQISRPDGVPFIDPLTFLPLRINGTDDGGSDAITGFSRNATKQWYGTETTDTNFYYNNTNRNMHTASLPFFMLDPADMKRGYARNIERTRDYNSNVISYQTGPVVDTDNDGYADARWFEAPFAGSDGIRWAMAMRIIDNSAMININTATMFNNDSFDTTGSTPADVDLLGFMFHRNTLNGDYYFTPEGTDQVIPKAEALGEFHELISRRSMDWKGFNGPAILNSFQRETMWRAQGLAITDSSELYVYVDSMKDQVSYVRNEPETHWEFPYSGSGANKFTTLGSFGLDTEADLRYSYGMVRKPGMISELDRALDSNNTAKGSKSVVRTRGNQLLKDQASDDYFGEGFLASPDHAMLNSGFDEDPNEIMKRTEIYWLTRDRRKHLTTMSGARTFRPRHLVDQGIDFAFAYGNGGSPAPNYNELRYSLFKADINKIKMAEIYTKKDDDALTTLSPPAVKIFHGDKNTRDIDGNTDVYDKYAAEHYARLFFDAIMNSTDVKYDAAKSSTRGVKMNYENDATDPALANIQLADQSLPYDSLSLVNLTITKLQGRLIVLMH